MVRRGAQRHVKRGRGSGAAADVHDDGDDDGDVTVELPRFGAWGWMDRWVKSHHISMIFHGKLMELIFLWDFFWNLTFYGLFFGP